ncbi:MULTISPECIES: hypothetical protein [Prevotellaceae]|jgi:hypothetical protein|uniref:hypothetical protein n=1 Tax=Leyella stercorea TaxID=363265 RepID=UPI001F1AF92B|nr:MULTISPECIES: hypothetical protein [Prevotellaceae]MCF2643933.1 hypothetical protein [Leyella stercorea]MCI6130383.1 hypothetical protein [Prevotella sp.]MCI7249772.1 hypothetical protein [Prevotella sp.]MCI7370584.1 hypothetical protein [Prevotella sp.]MDD6198994.1 hypothetical protein [Prevotella sp.]
MRKILFLLPPMVLALVVGMLTSCRFAASYNDGDTIAASEFEPADTSLVSKRQVKDTLNHVAQNIVDSTDIFYVGTGSTRHFLQLVSYPSKRDTLVYGKTLHIKVKGSADFNSIVRVKFYLLNGKDSLVSAVEQVEIN